MISSNQPNSSTAPIIASAFNSKNVRGITSKQLIMVTIKACKKLKLSYNKIKTVWKLCTKNTVVEEPITNPELCFVLKGEVVRNSNLFNTS